MMQPSSPSSLNNNNIFSQNPSWEYSQNYNLMPSDGASSSSTMLNNNNIVDSTTTNMQNLLQRENSNTLSFSDGSYFPEKALSTGSSGSTSKTKTVMPIISSKLSPTSRKNKDKVIISQPILFMDSNSSKQEVLNQLLNYLYQNEKVNREWVTYRKKMLVQFEKKQGANRPGSPYILFTMDARVKHKAKHSGTGTPALNLHATDLSKMWATVQPDVKKQYETKFLKLQNLYIETINKMQATKEYQEHVLYLDSHVKTEWAINRGIVAKGNASNENDTNNNNNNMEDGIVTDTITVPSVVASTAVTARAKSTTTTRTNEKMKINKNTDAYINTDKENQHL
jgi:hypothetical protein